MNWRESSDARSLTIVIPTDIDVSKDQIESAVRSVIEESETNIDESTDDDGVRKYGRGYKC